MEENLFKEFINIVRKLRSKEGCPWDREQTHQSLRQSIIEESYEAAEAIDNQDMENLCEELGDMLLLVLLHSTIAEENGNFRIEDILSGIIEKMIYRHPHVFGEQKARNREEVHRIWEERKMQEKKETKPSESMLRIPKALPALVRAEKVLKKAGKENSLFSEKEELFESLRKSLNEMEKDCETGDFDKINQKFGSFLLTTVLLSLFLKQNAENSLTNATNAFINRFISAEDAKKID